LALWVCGVFLGIFAVVGDEIQPLEWNAYYNFPIIGQLPKFGGSGRIGAWDLAFIFILISAFFSMILYGDLTNPRN